MAQRPSPKSGGKVSRRDFIKLMAAAGTVMTFAVFADWKISSTSKTAIN